MLKKLRSPLVCLLVSGLLLSVGLAGLFLLDLFQAIDPFLGEVTRADGEHRLRLLKVVEGPLDYSWSPSLIDRYLLRQGQCVPPFDIHLNGIDEQYSQPGHTFLFRTVDPEGRYTNSAGPNLRFEFVESTGFVFQTSQDRGNRLKDFSHWDTHALTRCALPRRDKELRIRIHEGASKPLDLVVPNPCYRNDFSEWHADTLPSQKTKGSLTVKLESLDWQYNRSLPLIPKYKVTSTDGAWGSPEYDRILEDATGNLGSNLSPFEPVWKLKAYVHQSQAAEFSEDSRTVIGKLPLLAPGTVSKLDRPFKVGEVECRLLCVAGPGVVRETGGEYTARHIEKADMDRQYYGVDSSRWNDGQSFRWVMREAPFIWIELLTKFSPHTQIVVQMTKGGQRTACPQRDIFTNQRRFIVAEIPADPSFSEVELTFAISHPEEFEFFVTPPASARAELMKPKPGY